MIDKIMKSESHVAEVARFTFSSVSSTVLDLILYQIFFLALYKSFPVAAIYVATWTARVISATFCFIINKKYVFSSDVNTTKSGIEFAILTFFKTLISAMAVEYFVTNYPELLGSSLAWKALIDALLFIVNFACQKAFIFIEPKEVAHDNASDDIIDDIMDEVFDTILNETV